MAIERMKSVWLFAPHGAAKDVLDRLAGMGLSHLTDCSDTPEEDLEKLGVARVYPEAGELERRAQRLREVLDTLQAYHKTSREFLENFITTPVEVREAEVRGALDEVDIERLHADVKQRERHVHTLTASLQRARGDLRALVDLEDVRSMIPGRADQHRVFRALGVMSLLKLKGLQADERLPETCALSVIAERRRKAVVQIGGMVADRDGLESLLREYGCALIEPDKDTVAVAEYLARRREEVARNRKDLDEARAALTDLAKANRRNVELALGYWEERLNIAEAAALLAESKRLTIAKGYVRARELEGFQGRLADEMPGVAMLVRDPAPGENVPVSLKNPKVFAPAQFLVSMFGLPNYFTFDPTQFLTLSFLVFFGMCFGDAVYGVLLIALGTALAKKYREYTNLRNFFNLLAYAGVASTLVGALTGAWAADLFSYLGTGNPLLRLSNALLVMDPILTPLTVLGISLLLGVANQLLGIVMLMYRNIRQGDPLAAIFDGAFWLLVLPSLVALAAGMFVTVPDIVRTVAYVLIAVGAVGLVLTQGRAEKSLVGKAVIGVVSLYGIVGTYGATTFVGDTLSYCRLLALGLTTSIVGGCFNVIADMVRGVPYLGIVLFVLVVVVGHTFNFLISILGGFVHSARLIFVEFFGRFYEGGSPQFVPLGTWQGRIRVMDRETVWTD